MKKIISLGTIIIITFNLIISVYNTYSYASQTSTDIDGINEAKYPGIKSAIQQLKNQYPNWEFKIFYTGLDWAEAVTAEFSGHREYAKNQVSVGGSYDGDWICPLCRDYHKSTWYHASLLAIQYMMDPRNSLDSTSIFQFEELTNNGYDRSAIDSMINGTFLQGHTSEIEDATNQTKINPYYIVAKILQEQGSSGSKLTTGELGYYNPFNIGAAGSTSQADIENGLAYAQEKGWDTLTKGIVGGVNFIASNYINKGQNTIYLQKFDVSDVDGRLYANQYMQNVLGAENEGRIMRNSYMSSGILASKHTFIIPVYENMPSTKIARPSTSDTSANVTTINTIQTKLFRINSTDKLRIRESETGDTIDWIDRGEIVTLVKEATSKINGTYWDKIRTGSGLEGYVARETYEYEPIYRKYLIEVN